MINTLLLEYARKHKVKKFINLNTINAYPESDDLLKESNIWNGFPNRDIFSYGISKRVSLAQSLAYFLQYDFSSINLILDNTYGPYDNFNPNDSRVIPALIHKFYSAKKKKIKDVNVWGSGNSIRQFLYVKDLVKIIYLFITNNYEKNIIINISNGKSITIKELALKIATQINYSGKIIFDNHKPEGSNIRIMDNSLMKDFINFNSFTSIDKGLKETISWYKSFVL